METQTTSTTFSWSRVLTNTRQQDLFLLAKGTYDTKGRSLPVADAARLVVGMHNVYSPHDLPWDAAATCVVGDLVGSVLVLEGDKLKRFLVEMGPSILDRMLGQPERHHRDGGYFRVLIESVCSGVLIAQVRSGDEWLMPFPEPTPNDFVREYLASQVRK